MTRDPNETALAATQFDAAMEKTGHAAVRNFAVAVSGGGDSMALALLLRDWCRIRGAKLTAFTVDHGLRAEARAEAERVGDILRDAGLTHEILTWHGAKPATHVQELAREARYKLLIAACHAHGCDALAVAHNLEDQMETFWMRLAHGSGLDGLAGMAASRNVDGIAVMRPVMGFSRAQLRDICAAYGIDWIEDPSNNNEKYLRVKLRSFEEMLAAEGLTPQRLAATLQKLEDAREALQDVAAGVAAEVLTLHEEGYATLQLEQWRVLPRDLQRRVLTMALQTVSPQAYAPGFDGIETARIDMMNESFAGQTLAGCEIIAAGEAVLVVREAAAAEGRVAATEGILWDRRFIVSGVTTAALVGALGDSGLTALKKNPALETALKAIPFKARRVMPALWGANDELLAVPHLDYYSDEAFRGSKLVFRK